MTVDLLATLITAAGVAQFGVLSASALVPFRLNWRQELQVLSPLHRQMYWTYGGFIVLSIVAFALLSTFNARELASGSRLARWMCGYMAVFWGVRLALQAVFDVRSHLTLWWLKLGYVALSITFAGLTAVYFVAALGIAR
jgi:hypothetical protein